MTTRRILTRFLNQRGAAVPGGTGYQPVPPGYQPSGMGRNADWNEHAHSLMIVFFRSARRVAARHRLVACATRRRSRHCFARHTENGVGMHP